MTTAVLLGLIVATCALAVCFAVVYASWAYRVRRRRLRRLIERAAQQDELERAERRLRLRIQPRPT